MTASPSPQGDHYASLTHIDSAPRTTISTEEKRITLKARFLGAVGTVTGSCTLVHHELTDSYYLIDCGMYQGDAGSYERNRRPFDFDPKRIAAVMLTHAHLDHCGLLPRLVSEGFRGKVYCTRPTAEFTKIALRDRGAGNDDLWPEKSVKQLDGMFVCPDNWPGFKFGHSYKLGQELFFSFLRSSHIVGAVCVALRINNSAKEKDYSTVIFSGDLGTTVDASDSGGLQKRRQLPGPRTGVVVCESTNGSRTRTAGVASFKSRITSLADALLPVLDDRENATVILPTFALQRTQDLLFDIDHVLRSDERVAAGRDIDLFITSRLTRRHSKAMYDAFRQRNHKGERTWLNTDSPMFAGLGDDGLDGRLRSLLLPDPNGELIDCGGRRLRLQTGVPPRGHAGQSIVLAAPGMCTGGPSLNLLGRYALEPNARIAFTGYIPASSPASPLLEYAKSASDASAKPGDITLGRTTLSRGDIRASIVNLGPFFSGHADASSLVNFVLVRDDKTKAESTNEPVCVILNHGDRRGREALARLIKETSLERGEDARRIKAVHAPTLTDGWFDLVAGEWVGADFAFGDSTRALLEQEAASDPRFAELLRQKGLIGS